MSVRVFLTHFKRDYDVMNEVYARFFPEGARPARTCVGVTDLVRDALYGRLGDLSDSLYGMPLLCALDRHDAADGLRALQARHDVVLLDRYVASNAAYGAARLHQDADGPFVRWVRTLEIERFGLPVPDAQLLLRVPPAVAAARADGRAAADEKRAKDAFEADAGLQGRCAGVYQQLASSDWLSPWFVIDTTAPAATCTDLASQLLCG